MTAKIAAILIVAICFNSMSAIVSDNDGSAFVTKAEFEAMKDNFADQVENYENSIDGKIDGAIAAYLAGIKTTRKMVITNMFINAKKNDKNNLVFALWATPAQAINVEDVVAGYFVGRADGGGDGDNATSGGKYGYCQVSNVNAGSGGYGECEYLGTTKKNSSKFYNDDKKNWTSAYYFVNFPFKGENEKKDLDNWTLQEIKRKRLHMHLKANYSAFMSASYTGNIGSRFSGTVTTDYTTTLTQPGSFKHSSQGRHCHINLEPICTQVHEWSDFDKDSNFSSTNDDNKKNQFLKYNLAGEVKDSTAMRLSMSIAIIIIQVMKKDLEAKNPKIFKSRIEKTMGRQQLHIGAVVQIVHIFKGRHSYLTLPRNMIVHLCLNIIFKRSST